MNTLAALELYGKILSRIRDMQLRILKLENEKLRAELELKIFAQKKKKLIRRERAKWVFLFDKKHGDFSRRFNTPPYFDAEQIVQAIERGGFVIFDYRKLFPGEAEKGFDFFTKLVWPICQELKGRKIF